MDITNSSYITDTPHFSWLTFISSILVALLTSFIVPMYIKPYFNTKAVFKQHLIETWTHLSFYSAIYAAYFINTEIQRKEFYEEVIEAKDELRKCWVNLETSYYLIPKIYKLILIKVNCLPKFEELSSICGDIRAISNSTIIYNSESSYNSNRVTDRKNRVDAIDRVNCFISKYTDIKYTKVKLNNYCKKV